MGDKGGKKDKEKHKQQQLTKQKQEEQKEAGQGPAKDSVAEVHRQAVVGKASCQTIDLPASLSQCQRAAGEGLHRKAGAFPWRSASDALLCRHSR